MSEQQEIEMSEEQIYAQIEEEQKKQSRFMKLENKEIVTVKFNRKATKIVDKEFNGKKSKRVEYEVADVKHPLDVKILPMALRNAITINSLLKQGFDTITITRIGTDKNTTYTFVPKTGQSS